MFVYRYKDRPKFLEGAFHWKEKGYSYAVPPEIDLGDERSLRHEDPWVALAAAVESAKSSKIPNIDYLKEFANSADTAPTLVSAITDFIADAGSRNDLEYLAELLIDGPEHLKLVACQSAGWAGEIWLVPFILEALDTMSRQVDRDAIETVLSHLLDPMDEEELLFFGGRYSPEEYRERVRNRIEEIKDLAGSEEVSVLGGEPIDMPRIIWRMRKHLSDRGDGWRDWSDFLILRHKFEAFTGADCSGFYDAHKFQPLSASAAIEDFVQAHPVLDMKAGLRYFFLRCIDQHDVEDRDEIRL